MLQPPCMFRTVSGKSLPGKKSPVKGQGQGQGSVRDMNRFRVQEGGEVSGGFFPKTVLHNLGSALLNSNPWFSNKTSLTLFKLRVTFISNFLPTIKVVRRKKAFALSERGFLTIFLFLPFIQNYWFHEHYCTFAKSNIF